jgi:hypothetical protein
LLNGNLVATIEVWLQNWIVADLTPAVLRKGKHLTQNFIMGCLSSDLFSGDWMAIQLLIRDAEYTFFYTGISPILQWEPGRPVRVRDVSRRLVADFILIG